MSYRGHVVSVVIPVHNEAAFIADVIRTIPTYVDTIIVVDDASTDGSVDAARAAGDSRMQILPLSIHAGVGGAMVAGYRRALELGSDVVVKMDGDRQMPPDQLPSLLDAIVQEGYSYAKGNRFLANSPALTMPRHRLLGNMILTFLTKAASGYWHIFDPQNGYTAISGEALRRLDLDSLDKGYFFENDVLVHLNLWNARIKDVPMQAYYGHERSEIRPAQIAVSFPRLLVQRLAYRIYRKYVLRDFSPVALFLITGSFLFLWGIGFGTFLWIRGLVLNVPTPTGTIMLAIVPLFLGFQLVLQAIVLDIQQTPR